MTTHLQAAVTQALRKASHKTVLSDGSNSVTGNELAEAVTSVQQLMDAAQIIEGDRVLIELERSIQYVTTIIACVQNSVTYVPIASNTPKERKEAIAAHCSAAASISLDPDGELQVDHFSVRRENRPILQHASDLLAYIIYTSGTTGAPKGVAVSQHALWSFACQDSRIAMPAPETCLCCASVSFDANVYEIWPTILGGGTVLLYAGNSFHLDELCEFTREWSPDRAFLTTKLFQAIEQSTLRESLFSIKNLFVGGETISPQSFSRVREQMGDRIRAAYGPTEAVVFTTLEQSDDRFESEVPIGTAMQGKELLVLDDDLRPCEPGEIGEIYISGGLAEGYFADLTGTATRFLPNPTRSGEIMYRTGDLGTINASGTASFRGRTDGQVKIRGFRVELGAIESFYLSQPEIENCLCFIVTTDPDDPRLCLYFTSNQARLNTATLRRRPRSVLEEYMIPDLFIQVDNFETNQSGKIDRSALPTPYLKRTDIGLSTAYVAPEDDIESRIVQLFCRELRITDVGVDDNFYELGGNSLSSMSLLQSLSDAGFAVSARELFSNPSPRQLAAKTAATGRR